ncbi:DMT family transporter [Planctomonas psychrotolerans]|uniref:DMT family transporter n=1 Tax=Planctomonas psychrotolerans TaxID=2528712 RepID=UPI001238D3D2|nr:EamA family transporter [Planctomonas psychrotolerans]
MRPVLLVLLAAVLFGTTGTAQALGAPDVNAVSLGSARVVIGGSALALVAVLLSRRARVLRGGTFSAPVRPETGGPQGVVGGTPGGSTGTSTGTGLIRAVRSARRADGVIPVLVGAFGVVVYQPAFFLGTERNGVAIGTLVALGTAPLATGVLAWAFGRRFPGARWCIATTVAVLGLALLAGAGSLGGLGSASGADPVGLAGSLAAGVAYAVYTIMSKRLLDLGWGSADAMAAVFGAAAVLALVLVLTTDVSWIGTAPGVLTVLWLGLVTVCVAYLLFAAGLRHLPAASVATITLAEPLTAALLGIGLLGETLAPTSWAGLAAIATGILILLVSTRPRSTGGSKPVVVR